MILANLSISLETIQVYNFIISHRKFMAKCPLLILVAFCVSFYGKHQFFDQSQFLDESKGRWQTLFNRYNRISLRMKKKVSMSKLESLLREASKNLIGRNITRLPTAPTVTTPLLTNFTKWSDKKKKLSFKSEKDFSSVLPNFHLEKNLLAQLLASPMRCDRVTRLKVPKDFLIQLKLKKLNNNEAERDASKRNKTLELLPLVEHSRISQSSYVSNSLQTLADKSTSFGKWIPMSVLTSDMRNFSVSEIDFEKNTFLSQYKQDMLHLIMEGLKELVTTQKERTPVILEDWDILVTYDASNPIDLELKTLSQTDRLTIIVLNLARANSEELESMVNGPLKNNDSGIVLKFLKSESLVRLVYKLLAFSH